MCGGGGEREEVSGGGGGSVDGVKYYVACTTYNVMSCFLCRLFSVIITITIIILFLCFSL